MGPHLNPGIHHPSITGPLTYGPSCMHSGRLSYGGVAHPSQWVCGPPLTHGGVAHLPLTHGGAAHLPLTHGGVAHLPLTYGGAAHLPLTHGGVAHLRLTHSGVAHLPLTHGRSLWQSLHGYIGGCHVVGALGFGGLVGTGNIRLGFVSFKLWTCCGLSLSGCGLIGSEFSVVMAYLRTLVNVVWGAGWGLGCRDIFVV